MADLASVRRLEAVAFRAWPAVSTQYDGSWLIRLTAGHPSKRVNSVNPLDPSDTRDIAVRLEKAGKRFSDYGRPLLVRQTPLAPPALIAFMDEAGWSHVGETAVMMANLSDTALPESADGVEHLPSRDVGRFVDARIRVSGDDPALKPGLTEIVSAIKPETGLFIFEEPGFGPSAVSLTVQDNDLAGVLQLAVAPELRCRGIGTTIFHSSMRWARLRGAKRAWVQAEVGNEGALALYRNAGFREVYRYIYRGPAKP
ncbi:GNAT family N-acetyltransferase [Rhizobium sp. ARZ01]|uniref:GNAT family N-acetyltransferase n=1 Tax=Rhizobium sp. ARZ01 TaxID=2769313 RepID=UPI001786500E|nr:GNAT family N-acetyltransferase [Rhizobium sp. ARZ01]MBD9374956.1 GNAT family N-acetyltransferase [Rhizobium sp. ARZ01]